MNIFKRLQSGEGIFKNEEVFLPDYIPDAVVHRENEIGEIAYSLKGLVEREKGSGVLVYGPPGTGKTCTVRYILKELEEYSSRVLPVFINCWHHSTRYAILNEIGERLEYMLPRRGLAPDEIIMLIVEALKKTRKIPVVVLDEVDVVALSKTENMVLYDLLRLRETYSVSIGIIVITNNDGLLFKIDRRVRSSLLQTIQRFAPYSPLQLKEILKERAVEGLLPGVWKEEVIGMCAGIGARNGGDARVALTALYLAAKEAERRGANSIEIADVEKIKGRIFEALMKAEENGLSEEERRIVEVIEAAGEIKSGELYEKLKMSERAVRSHLERLLALGLIEAREENYGEGKTRLFKRKVPFLI